VFWRGFVLNDWLGAEHVVVGADQFSLRWLRCTSRQTGKAPIPVLSGDAAAVCSNGLVRTLTIAAASDCFKAGNRALVERTAASRLMLSASTHSESGYRGSAAKISARCAGVC
jgi:hypothetical protein